MSDLIRERYLLSQWRAERQADGRRWRLEAAPAGVQEVYDDIRARRRAEGQRETDPTPLPADCWAPLPDATDNDPELELAQRRAMARTLVTETWLPVHEIAARCGWHTAGPVTKMIWREGLVRPRPTQGMDGGQQARLIRRYEC